MFKYTKIIKKNSCKSDYVCSPTTKSLRHYTAVNEATVGSRKESARVSFLRSSYLLCALPPLSHVVTFILALSLPPLYAFSYCYYC
jgi:hypothetical protein